MGTIKSRYLIVIAGIIFIVAGSVSAAEKSWKRPPAPVEVAIASARLMAPITWVVGSVISRADARVAAETEGRLEFVVETGARVQQGEVIAKIEAVRLTLLFKEQQARVRRANAQRVFLKQEVKRLGRLAGQNNAARTQLERVDAEYQVADAESALAAAQLQQFQDMIDRSSVRAPFAGVIIERLVQAGEWATKGTVLLRLLDPQRLEIQADAPLSSLRYLTPGDELRVQSGTLVKMARLRALTNAAAGSSRQLTLRLDIDNSDWLVGQILRLAVPIAGRQSVIAVPRDALVMRRSGITVFRVNSENKAERIAVQTGIAEGDLIAVSGDIRAGDKVIVRGAERLRPEQIVNIINMAELE